MEGEAVVGVMDFGGKGLARLPFGRRSAMLVTAPGLFLDRDTVAVVVDDAAALLVVLLLPPALLFPISLILLLVLLPPTSLNCSSFLPLLIVLFTEALVSLRLDREGGLSLLSLLLLSVVVTGAAALSRTLLSIDDILGILVLMEYTSVGIVCIFTAVPVVVIDVAVVAVAADVEVVEKSNSCGALVVLSFVIRRVDCFVIDGDLDGRGKFLGDERGEEVEEV